MEVVSRDEYNDLLKRVEALEARGENRELMDANQTARYLNISQQGLYSMIRGMKLPSYKTGKKLYFKRSEIDAVITKVKKD